MQVTSELYKTLLASNHRKEIMVKIAGVEYMKPYLVQCSTRGGLFQDLSIGNAAAKRINLKIFPQETIPRQAKIEVYVRLTDGVQYSEWIPKGVYFFATRETDRRTGIMTVLGYDAMLKAEEIWLDSSYDEESWPMPVWDAVNDIAARMGVEVDERTALNEAHPVQYPVDESGDMTMRAVLRRIAVANAGNWRITDEGKLLMVPLVPGSYDIDIGNNVAELSPGLVAQAINKVEIINENGEIVGQAGDDTGRVLTAENPDGTDAMAADILAAVTGYVYRPYEAEDALIDPAAELGDGVTVGEFHSVLANEHITFDDLYSATISAPTTDEIEDEYPYLSEYQRIKRSIAGTRSLISKTAEEIRLEVENELEGLSSSFTVELDSIRAEVTGVEDAISYIELDVESITSRVQDAEGNISALEQTATNFSLRLDDAEGVVSQMLYMDASSGFIFSNETGQKVTINGGQVELDTLLGSTIYFKDAGGNIAADFAVTGASSTYQRKLVLSSGAFEVATYGGSIFLSSNLGPQLLLGRAGESGEVYCQLSGGPLVVGADSYGTSLPSTGTYGQVFFLLS